jgi:uncharacterized protein (TIGR02996 family)
MAAPYDDSPEYRALFAGVVERPDDDAPRLVLADWLEENGHPERAELIRLQIELERTPRHDPRHAELRRRDAEFNKLKWDWMLPISGLGHAHFDPFYRRGFQYSLTSRHWKAFNDQADKLFALAPLQELHVVTLPPRNVKALSRSPHLPRLRKLRLHVKFGEADFFLLVNKPLIASLTGLDVKGSSEGKLGAAAAVALAGSPQMSGLTDLELSSFDLGDEGAAALAGSPFAANLTRLHLAYCGFGAAGARALAANLGPLYDLWLSSNPIGPEGAEALLCRRELAGLEVLHLSSCRVGPGGARALAAASHLRCLTGLDLDRNGIGPQGAGDLAGASHLATLTGLNLDRNDLGDAGVAALAASPHLGSLTWLNLSGNRIGSAGVAALADAKFGPECRLRFARSDVDEAGKAVLTQRYGQRVEFEYG